MASNNETSANALELHIKVNDQNLLAASDKCNIGTLRLPSDPSWPKIPLRRLTSNIDVIKHPCVVTLTGTPQKNRSIVQTMCQYSKPKINQKQKASMYIPKRLPGSIDPRFKRQISRREAEKKPDEVCNAKNDEKQTKLKLNTCIPQKNKKVEDNSQRRNQNIESKESLESIRKSVEGIVDHPIEGQCASETNQCIKVVQHDDENTTDERYNVGNVFSQEQKQEVNRPLFLMVDEKKLHTLPINTLNVKTAASPSTQAQQCYSIQIPVVAYHNVLLQMSNMPTQVQEGAKISYKYRSNKKHEQTVENNCTISTLIDSTIYTSKESIDRKSVQQCNVKNNDDILEKKNIPPCDERHNFHCNIYEKKNTNSNISLNRDVLKEISIDKNRHENVDMIDNTEGARIGENFSNPICRNERLETIAGKEGSDSRNNDTLHHRSHSMRSVLHDNLNYNINSCIVDCITDECIEREKSNEKKRDVYTHPCTITRKQSHIHHSYVKDERCDMNEFSTNITTNNKSPKNVQSLFLDQVRGKEFKENSENTMQHRKLCSSLKRKTAPINLSRKVKSFFRKKSRLAITDSDCTLILPGPRRIKGKQCGETHSRLKVSRLLHRRSGINSMNSIRMKSDMLRQNRINQNRSLTTIQAKYSFEKASSIPLETQELLNKSYWEYYRKLRHKIVSAKLNIAEKKDKCSIEPQNHSSESQTLHQCSMLSCMINNTLNAALRDSPDQKLFLDSGGHIISKTHANNPIASSLSSVFTKQIQRKQTKRTGKRLHNLQIIALLSITMYIAIIFLPMMYDYFFYEDYDENTDYTGLVLEYIISSFVEAFDEIVDALNTVFLRSVRFKRKL